MNVDLSVPPCPTKTVVKSRTKILLVDDTEDNLLLLEALLKSDDHELIKARSGKEALEVLLIHEVALALLDVHMPGMHGFELARRMRMMERTRQTPIVFITGGSHDPESTFEGYSQGAVDFLYKPVDAHILRSKVDVFVQLHRQKQELAAQLHLNEMLTAAIGHDLRCPLQTIFIGAQVLKESKDDRILWAGDRIRSSAERMTKLIADLLEFSSARLKGVLPIEPVPTNLLDLTRKVVSEQELADPSARIEIQQAGDFRGDWDERRTQQALSNVIGSALSCGVRSEPVRIELDGWNAADVVVRVSNMGVIPPQALPGIFDPFRDAGGSQSESRAVAPGLGLYVAQQIVHSHGGEISVHSTPLSGTCFTLRLPRSAPHEVAQPCAFTA